MSDRNGYISIGGRYVDVRYSEKRIDSPLWVGANIRVKRSELALFTEDDIYAAGDDLAALFRSGYPQADCQSIAFIRGMTLGGLMVAKKMPS